MKRSEYVHVTEVLKIAAPNPELAQALRFNRKAVDKAAERGNCLQEIAEEVLRGKKISPGLLAAARRIDERSDQWAQRFIDFGGMAGWKLKKAFHRMYDDELCTTGELDFFVEGGTKDMPLEMIVDLKVTAGVPSNIKAQLGGYIRLFYKDRKPKKLMGAGCLHAPIGKRPKFTFYKPNECTDEWDRAWKKYRRIKDGNSN